MSGKALVPGPRRRKETEPEPPKFERVLVRTEEQKKKLAKARKVTDRKRGNLGEDLSYEVRAERAKITDLDVGANHIFFKLTCAYCGELLEGQGLGNLRSFVRNYLRPLRLPWALRRRGEEKPRNRMKNFRRTCPNCGLKNIRGHLEVKIKDEVIEAAKTERFEGEREIERFGGVLTFQDFKIKNGKFPRGTRYLGKDSPAVLRYVCGSCGREGFSLDAQRLFKELLKETDEAWESGKSVQDKKVDMQFRCPECTNEMRINGTVDITFPESRKAVIQAHNLWLKDAHSLVHEKTSLLLSLDFEDAFYEARKAETQKS